MASETHAKLSASCAHIWLNCTKSPSISANFEDIETIYSREGTMVHLLNEIRLCELLGIHTDEKLPTDFEYSEELKEASDEYVNYIMDLITEIKQRCNDPVILIEQKVDFSNFKSGLF